MKAAIHLHLFYPDVAIELIGRVARLGRPDIAVLATHCGPLDPAVARALETLPAVRTIETPNLGWDIGPLLHVLPQLRDLGVEAVAHLHTKKGDSGYAPEWRAMAYEGTIADAALVERIIAAFADDADLALVGARALYKSAASHQFRNAELLAELAPRLLAPYYPPADWGFFAGTFFWARLGLLERLIPFGDFGEGGERDGTLAHALERLIGLAPVAHGGRIGLVGEDGEIETVAAPGAPDHEPIIRSLVARAERNVGPLDPELAALIGRRNPLIDYIRHGRDLDALDPNPYFSSAWYNRIHEDVFRAGMHPLYHYTHHGAPEGRSTGPLFDGLYYRRAYDDVTGDPLRHFLETGAAEGRVAIPISQPDYQDAERPRRFYRHFDVAAEAAFLREMAQLPDRVAAKAGATLVSVIMPAWNREASIGAAIRSVLAQSHGRFELIVVDDGSTDATRDIVAGFLGDGRVRLIEGGHGGVSAARNLGLEHARGDIIAYLDSDNRWAAWFLEVMVRFMTARGLDAAYSGIALRDDLGQLTGYRGDDFDWEACLAQNYVDLNAFCHRRELLAETGGFDANLRRMVDWDLILRIGRARPVGYAPFVGCDYFDGKADMARITVGESSAFQKLVWTKNRFALATGTPAFAAKIVLNFAIKIAAPEADKAAWGDWHFAEALGAAIERLGHKARVDVRERWTGHALADEDVAIVLRGLIPYTPRPGQMAFLWNISHPDQVPLEEYDRFTRVYVASESHAALLRHMIRPPVAALLQATDPARFHPVDAPESEPLVFVGNSRGVDRDIVNWAIAAGRPPVIYGDGWEGRVPAELVRAANIDNRRLGALYATAGAVLNDHWPSMRAFGYLSNRLFDIAASAGRAISDPVPSMGHVFGDAVAQVDGPAALRAALDAAAGRPRDLALARRVADEHSFDARARRLVGDACAALGLAGPPVAPAIIGKAPVRVHIVAPFGPHGPQSSAYIRLICPLTDESVSGRAVVSLGAEGDPLPDGTDICVVQRTALSSVAAVDRLVGRLGAMGAALVTDVDDAFIAIGPDHPEAARYAPLNAALERAIAASAETWFSTAPLAALYAKVAGRRHVQPNALDPRLWRDWRHARPAPFGGDRLHLLYMGTHTHDADLAMLRPALDRLWEERPDRFDLTLIGVAAEADGAPWLRRIGLPAEVIAYPRFVRWLRAQGPFDLGLAPLADNAFNRAKSDIKLLDYAALGLLPVVASGPAYGADPSLAALALATDDWHGALSWALDRPDEARARAAAAQDRLWATRTVGAVAPMMLERLEALVR
ncbi:glycosyltransferase [Sphingomonas quercus]|uniref:Glycosyltransferase n=1 Tax=Sphingomonas quercus TaxID=2842451 RepID=A0ABS6BFB1_9SPHN|nr:glycosyltransferase [Sphingomonas quercus]MBU3076993.1 glycosyltransferase [Sphingomonas quercus]